MRGAASVGARRGRGRRSIRVAAAWALLGLGCAGLLGPDPTRLALLDLALTEADPVHAVDLFILGSADAGSVWFDCADAFEAAASSDDPAARATLLAHAFQDWTTLCPSPCAPLLGPLTALAPPEQTAVALALCDAEGPDPVFGGPLATLRPSMSALDYLAVRMLAEIALDALPSFDAQLPKLAVGLALQTTPLDVAPTSDLRVVSDRPLPSDAFAPLQGAVLACGPTAALAHRIVTDGEGRVVGVAGPEAPCVTEALAGFALPASPDGAYAVVDLAWKPEPTAPARTRPPSPSTPSVSGSIDRDVLQGVMRANIGKMRYCYEKQLRDQPTLAGRVDVTFVIGVDGAVSTAEGTENTLERAGGPVEACLVGVVRGLTFPAPATPVTVRWPMVFVAQ